MRFVRVVVAAMLVTGAVVETDTAASAAPAWSVSTSPNPVGPPTANLNAVSCPTITSCFAAGYFNGYPTTKSLVQQWNGSSWSTLPTPNPAGDTGTLLRDIDCTTETSCFAVGHSAGQHDDWTLVERWNGTAWSIVPSPTPPGTTAALYGVSCVSTTSCFAVGAVEASGVDKPLIERWNGTSWTVVASPTPAGATSSGLASVDCTTATSCFAVGRYDASGINKTLVERWNGATWSIGASPNPAGSSFTALAAVACTSTTSCFAVGQQVAGGTKSLVERWNGTNWSIVASPNPAGSSITQLVDVSCSSTTSCFAAGFRTFDTGDGLNFATLTEQWNGTSWSIVSSPNPSNTGDSTFEGVSCSSATMCVAVGSYYPLAANDPDVATLAERWNGTAWSIAAPGGSRSELLAVSCPSTASCFAVGNSFGGTVTRPLLERWNGTAWATQPSPSVDPASMVASLNGVACASVSTCFAVGSYSTGTTTKSLIERWNGGSWSVIPSPSPAGASSTILNAVSCSSATNCFAVGTYIAANNWRTFAQRWNGTSWVISPIPNPGPDANSLYGVSCTSATSCFAVGRKGGYVGTTVVEQWNGASWSILTSPNPEAADSALLGISCVSATSCTAVGRYVLGEASEVKTLVQRWNGTRWRIVGSVDPAREFSTLTAVSCGSPTSCVAVGSSSQSQITPSVTLIESWNGTDFAVVSSPNPAESTRSYLKGISCVNATSCHTVGGYHARGSRRTLVERYA